MGIELIDRLDLGELVTFIPNRDLPIYSWYYFKEGYSRDFVHYMINVFQVYPGDIILDPFMGVGTTLLACREMGIHSIGVEVNPFFYLVARAKLYKYDVDELRQWIDWVMGLKFRRPNLSKLSELTRRAFNRGTLEEIVFLRDRIMEVKDEGPRLFLLMGLINASSKVTYAVKDGSIIRIVRRPTPPFRKFYRRILIRMLRDIEELKLEDTMILLYNDDARRLSKIVRDRVDYIITSPPYLNKIEYTKVYEIEMDLFLKDRDVIPLRSYIGLMPRKRFNISIDMDISRYPLSAQAYLYDMWIVLNEFYKVLRDGGRMAIVVAEGAYPDVIVPVDEILMVMAGEIGFKPREIWVANKRIVTRDRTLKIGVARESILIIDK